MKILDWIRGKRQEQEREAETLDEMRRVDETEVPVPSETYMSQTRD